jgi:FkbM family methyltransferase
MGMAQKQINMKYSQNNEETLILDFFKDQNHGTFLDIGANDGITLSNTYALLDMGWDAVYIEASPKAYERLMANIFAKRNGNIFTSNIAVGDRNEYVEFYESGELLGSGDAALVSSLYSAEIKRWDSLNIPFEKISVEMVDFKTLLSRIPEVYRRFDLLSLDIEGGEMSVLPQIDFNQLGIKMAIIEWNSKNAEFYDNIMFNFGFKLLSTNPENRIYAK